MSRFQDVEKNSMDFFPFLGYVDKINHQVFGVWDVEKNSDVKGLNICTDGEINVERNSQIFFISRHPVPRMSRKTQTYRDQNICTNGKLNVLRLLFDATMIESIKAKK